jgi:molecular chaperone GrpE
VSGKSPEDRSAGDVEGREALEEESIGTLTPSPEMEEALREVVEKYGDADPPSKGPPARGAPVPNVKLPSEENEELRAENEHLVERLTRLTADLENLRKRGLKEREDAFRYGHENLVKDLLGSVDNLERAVAHAQSREDGGDFESMLQGVELVQRELIGALSKHGVERIDAEGKAFDPTEHEAMAQKEDDSVPAHTVVEAYQAGYKLRDRLLRPARVVVSKASESGEKQGSEGGGGDSEA